MHRSSLHVDDRSPGAMVRLLMLAEQARGYANWLREREYRATIARRFELAVAGTAHERNATQVARRYFGLRQQGLGYERSPAARAMTAYKAADPTVRHGIYVFVHGPAMLCCLYGLANAGVPLHPVVDAWFWDDPLVETRVAALQASGGDAVAVEVGFEKMAAILASGGSLAITQDVAGSTPARFLGKPARLRSGAVRLAHATGLPLLPMHGGFASGQPYVYVHNPILPGGDASETLDAVLASVQAPILRSPEMWMPYDHALWPEHGAPYAEAFDDDAAADQRPWIRTPHLRRESAA